MNKKEITDGHIAILGGGNIGKAIARGLVRSKAYKPFQIHITRRNIDQLEDMGKLGFKIGSDNLAAVKNCGIILMTVQPGQLVELIDKIKSSIDPRRHTIMSAVTGVSIADIKTKLQTKASVIRVMPNTAVAIGESMTCIAVNGKTGTALKKAVKLFDYVGSTLVISEELMVPATALCACGVAFFLRAIRSASQGGIQIGFDSEQALLMASQTARGAASLILESHGHPESEIDKVTTPRGCTIAGLNRMEHEGFSSAMIKGLVTATEIANSLFENGIRK